MSDKQNPAKQATKTGTPSRNKVVRQKSNSDKGQLTSTQPSRKRRDLSHLPPDLAAIASDPKKARAFLQKAGIMDKTGRLAAVYRRGEEEERKLRQEATTSELFLHVGDVADMGERFIEAWKKIEDGKHIEERHLTFSVLDDMMAVLSPKRLKLLRHLNKYKERSVASLARALDRKYKKVHNDVEALLHVGVIEQGPEGVRSIYDVVHITVGLR